MSARSVLIDAEVPSFLSSEQVVVRARTGELHYVAVDGVQDEPVAAAPSDVQFPHPLQIAAQGMVFVLQGDARLVAHGDSGHGVLQGPHVPMLLRAAFDVSLEGRGLEYAVHLDTKIREEIVDVVVDRRVGVFPPRLNLLERL